MKTHSVAELERNAHGIISEIPRGQATCIHDNGTPIAFLISPETYRKLELFEALAKGEADFAAGRTLTQAQVKERFSQPE